MVYNFVVVNEGNRKIPHGVVVHVNGNSPVWRTSNSGIEPTFELLFAKEKAFANVPQDDGNFARRVFTRDDPEFLEYATVGVNLPLYVLFKGRWETETTDIGEVLSYLEDRFLRDET